MLKFNSEKFLFLRRKPFVSYKTVASRLDNVSAAGKRIESHLVYSQTEVDKGGLTAVAN